MIRLAVVGTSGRKPQDLSRLSSKHMEWMAANVRSYISDVLCTTTDKITLVSGGSSWADHVAIQLYLSDDFGGLELYLPTEFNLKRKQYKNTHEGRLLNILHKQCQEKTGIDIFTELLSATSRIKVKKHVKRGFLPRNTLIAKNCDHLIAFVFGSDFDEKTKSPTNGGTFYTWQKTLHQNKICFNLDWM